jgi:hypothetical protein
MIQSRTWADLSDAEREDAMSTARLVDDLTARILAAETPHILEWAALRGSIARLAAFGLFESGTLTTTERTREALFKQPPLADLIAWRRDHPRDE